MLINNNTVKTGIVAARARMATHSDRTGKQVDIAMLLPLAEMAALNIAPDGTFSDAECLAWEAMQYAINLANNKE